MLFKFCKSIKESLDFADIMVFVGLGMAGTGLWLWEPKWALTIIGSIVLILGILGNSPSRKGG